MSFLQMIDKEYEDACNTFSDINEHLPVLYELGMECDSITEMGTRRGASTRAFLRTNANKIRAYDVRMFDHVENLFVHAREAGKDAQYIKANVLDIEIDECDLLFIDTWHANHQLTQELKLHGNKARKYLVFHDTHTYAVRDEKEDWQHYKDKHSIPGEGLLPAIINFLIANRHWRYKEIRTNNNGLSILERVG